MRLFIAVFLVSRAAGLFSQTVSFPEHLKKTYIAALQTNDSLVYYQCHVDSASQEITTTRGQKIKTKSKRITLTEKFVIHKKETGYTCGYYTSAFTDYPNKKFPYLTLKEVANWQFELQKTKVLTQEEVLLIAALETKTHAIVHYELKINKSCPNELVICSKKEREQVLVEGNYLLEKILKLE